MTLGPDHNLLALGRALDRVDDAVVANPGRPSPAESAQQGRPRGPRLHAQSVDCVCDGLPYRIGESANVVLSPPREDDVRQALARA